MSAKVEDVEDVTASLGELGIETSSSKDTSGAVAEHDDVWDDASEGPSYASALHREWTYRQNQFCKMGYRDGVAEGQKDSAQDGFNVGFRQSVQVGYKWGLVRGITSALASLSDSSREKLVPDVQCREKLRDLYNSLREISADDAFKMFQKSILQSNHPGEEPHITSEADIAVDSSKLESSSNDLVLLLRECPDIKDGVAMSPAI